MADNFNMKQFLMENKLGAYSKLKENEEQLQEREVIYVIEDGQCYRKDDEGNKDLVNMSYCKRFAESAGSLKDTIKEIQEGGVDVKELVKMVNDAQKSGKEIAVDGEPVIMWVASMGRLKTANSTYNIVYDIASGDSILSFDGEQVSLPPYTPKQQPAKIDTRTPEEKKKAADAWNDRFGPGGGYDLPTGGRRTFDEGKEEASGINERISDEAIERFEGLANIQDLTVLKAKLRMLTTEWLEEGFEKEDIIEYFEFLVNEV